MTPNFEVPEWVARAASSATWPHDAPALFVRAGSEPGRSLQVKALYTRTGEKRRQTRAIEVDSFECVAVRTTGRKTAFLFILEPDDSIGTIEWGSLGVVGRFRIAERRLNTLRACEAWRAFEPF